MPEFEKKEEYEKWKAGRSKTNVSENISGENVIKKKLLTIFFNLVPVIVLLFIGTILSSCGPNPNGKEGFGGIGILILYGLMMSLFSVLVGALIGKHKGRIASGFVWSLLLGPLGWLIVALMKDLRPKCSECGGVVVSGARKCKNCGATLHIEPSSIDNDKAGILLNKTTGLRDQKKRLTLIVLIVTLIGFILFMVIRAYQLS